MWRALTPSTIGYLVMVMTIKTSNTRASYFQIIIRHCPTPLWIFHLWLWGRPDDARFISPQGQSPRSPPPHMVIVVVFFIIIHFLPRDSCLHGIHEAPLPPVVPPLGSQAMAIHQGVLRALSLAGAPPPAYVLYRLLTCVLFMSSYLSNHVYTGIKSTAHVVDRVIPLQKLQEFSFRFPLFGLSLCHLCHCLLSLSCVCLLVDINNQKNSPFSCQLSSHTSPHLWLSIDTCSSYQQQEE